MLRLSQLMALGTLLTTLGFAQDLAGDWQGTLKEGPQEIRAIVRIASSDSGGLEATLFSIDQSPDRGIGMSADSVSLDGPTIRFAISQIRGSFEGKLSDDATSISGTWTQGQPLPLELRRANSETAWSDPSPHTTQLVTVGDQVELEVLDWGGSGRPIVLLAGLGNSAHIFDKFAPKLTAGYHVFGITRRGFGASSAPPPVGDATYSADRLGDDVLAVLDALKLERPVLAGHSLGGEELSSIGSRHPERVAGLIYLDAGYSYAYYDRSKGDFFIEVNEVRRQLDQLRSMPPDPMPLINELLETSLPELERSLRRRQEQLKTAEASASPPTHQPRPQIPPIQQAIHAGMQRHTVIDAPILAIYALEPVSGPQGSRALPGGEARNQMKLDQARAFEAGLLSARVIRLADANHFVFLSNEADVLREMEAFIEGLP